MSSNWNLGLENATGNWRVFLGDDDGIIPAELDYLVEALKQSSADAVVTRFAHYRWPITEEGKGRVSIWLGDPNKFRWTGLTGDAYRDSTNIHFPIPYSRTLFTFALQERVQKLQGGTLFTATAPDINFGAALAMESARTELMLGLTPFIVGTSPKSNELNPATKKDFERLNSISWLPELVHPFRQVNYLSYAEPVAQARRARGLELELPQVKRLIWRTLTSCEDHRNVRAYLLRIFPKDRFFIYATSPIAFIAKKPIRNMRIVTWAMLRLLLNKEKYSAMSSLELCNSQEAASHLQAVIDKRATRIARQHRTSGKGSDGRHISISVPPGVVAGWHQGIQKTQST
jgi:glycosyltransferase involved in cell wall biosynthesis